MALLMLPCGILYFTNVSYNTYIYLILPNLLQYTFVFLTTAELGDFDPELHPKGYVSEFRFVPNQTEDLEKAIAEQHLRLK